MERSPITCERGLLEALELLKKRIEKIETVCTEMGKTLFLAQSLIEQEDLQSAAGFDALYEHAGNGIEAVKSIMERKDNN